MTHRRVYGVRNKITLQFLFSGTMPLVGSTCWLLASHRGGEGGREQVSYVFQPWVDIFAPR